MIKIIVDTQEELNNVRRVLLSEACSHSECSAHPEEAYRKYSDLCAGCVEKYCVNKVVLYTKEIVEIPAPIVV